MYSIDYTVDKPSHNTLRDMMSTPLLRELESNDKVYFYQPTAVMNVNSYLKIELTSHYRWHRWFNLLTRSEAKMLQRELNDYIRECKEIDSNDFGDYNLTLIGFYNLIMQIKEVLLYSCKSNQVAMTLIEGEECDGEGYVFHSDYGSYKLVDRRHFSYYNFNLEKGWVT